MLSIIERSETVKVSERLWFILAAANSESVVEAQKRLSKPLIALDPGETTGVAIWLPERGTILLFQWKTKDLGPSFNFLCETIKEYGISHIRFEDYKVYDHKARDHVHNDLHTAQWIGCIKLCAFLLDLPWSMKLAQAAKTFWTDSKLKLVGAYTPGMRHARDALRHLLLMMIFPNKD